MGLRAVLQPLLGDSLPFVTAFPAVATVALYAGLWPALATVAGCTFWVALPSLLPGIGRPDEPLQLASFAISAIVMTFLCVHLRTAPSASTDHDSADMRATPLTRWLYMVTVGAVLIPAIVFAAATWWGYLKAVADGRASAERANFVVARQAERTLQVAEEIADRARVVAAGPDAELRQRAPELYARLDDLLLGIDAIGSVSIWDRDGLNLVHSRAQRVDPSLSIADRDYFKRLRDGAPEPVITGLLTGKVSSEQLFNIVYRRRGPGGEFAGAIVVSLSPRHFHDFYRDLAKDDPALATFSLFLADGELITRWPAGTSVNRVPASSPVLHAIASGRNAGVLTMESSFDKGTRRMVGFQQVGSTPLYATAGLTEETIFAGWYRFIGLLAAVMVPTTLGLVWVSWVALRRTQRVQAVLEQLREENRRRAHAEQALLQTQKLEALAQLTGGVAHDFNNLLAVVSNNTHLLGRMRLDPAAAQPIAAIGRAVSAGVRLTRQLLAFSRKQALRPEVIHLQEWLPGVGDLIRTTLGRNIELSLHAATDTPPIEVDVAELELALINLAVNAKDAMPDGGRLAFSARAARPNEAGTGEDRPMAAIIATDSGSGIPAEVLGRVFEPFFTTKPPGRGTGLGLSQVHGLCAQSGGSARVRSQPGKGTTVELFLPAVADREAPLRPRVPATPERLSGRVLLVEDNVDLAVANKSVLEGAGLRVEHVASADAALARLEGGAQCDIVLSDIAMPGELDGIHLAFRLRETRPSLPVILMTGFAAQIHVATGAGLKVLAKPCEPDELMAALRSALESRGAPAAPLVSPEPG